MSKNINCPKLRKQFEELKVFGNEIKTGLEVKKPDVLGLKKRQKSFLALFKEIDDYIFEIKFPEAVKMTIKIGGESKEELLKKFEKKDSQGNLVNNISERAMQMIAITKFKIAKKTEYLELLILTVKDLGFPLGATNYDIYDKLDELGLEKVPPEVGFQLRLQYEDQPTDETLLIGSELLLDLAAHHKFLAVLYRGGVRWLGHGDSGDLFGSGDRWVFRRSTS